MIRLADDGQSLIAGRRRWPVVEVEVEDVEVAALTFRIRRAVVVGENGWRLSVVWGTATHSDNHDTLTRGPFVEAPDTVEVGVIAPDGVLAYEPFGHVDAAGLAWLVEQVGTLASR